MLRVEYLIVVSGLYVLLVLVRYIRVEDFLVACELIALLVLFTLELKTSFSWMDVKSFKSCSP